MSEQDGLTLIESTNTVTGAASAGTTLPGSAGHRKYLLTVTGTNGACYFRSGVGAQTAVTSDCIIAPDAPVLVKLPSGDTNYAVLQVFAAGIFSIAAVD